MKSEPGMHRNIQLASADLDESDIAAVVDVLRSGRLALGPVTGRFERAMADYVGTTHAVAVSSGTAALHLSLRALGIGPGDEVLVPSFTFAASVNAILFTGATPVFVDIEPDTYNMDPARAQDRISPRTRAILAVDVFGHPAEWDPLRGLATEQGLHLVDDSCEALGASYRGRRIGVCADASTFAFYPNKQVTTGEGGMVVTDHAEIAEAARSLRNQGRRAMGEWLEHADLGYNYRLDEMSAALGVSQLARIDALLARRAWVAERYTERLSDLRNLRPPRVREHVEMSWFVYVVQLAAGIDRDAVIGQLAERGIPARAYFSPVHRQRYITERVPHIPELPVTDTVAARTLALPFHGKLGEEEIAVVVQALRELVG